MGDGPEFAITFLDRDGVFIDGEPLHEPPLGGKERRGGTGNHISRLIDEEIKRERLPPGWVGQVGVAREARRRETR